jgi:O-antigen ligase
MYAYSPIFLALYLLVSGNLNGINDRLGQSLFGNANILGMIMMVSLFCTIWKIVYGSKKYIIYNIIWGIASLYIIVLTGGRKYFLLPFIFLSLLLLFKNYKNNKITPIMYALLLIPCGFASAWAIMNIPVLYSNIGIRFEGLLKIFSGDISNSDPSTIVRFMMINNGWKWFLQKPLLGFGVNSYQILLSRILSSSYAHNNYIELMVDLGLTGLIVYYSYYIYLIARLVQIRDDLTGIRNFFLAFMLVLLLFEIGAVTYQFMSVHILIGLASSYIWLYEKKTSLQLQNAVT